MSLLRGCSSGQCEATCLAVNERRRGRESLPHVTVQPHNPASESSSPAASLGWLQKLGCVCFGARMQLRAGLAEMKHVPLARSCEEAQRLSSCVSVVSLENSALRDRPLAAHPCYGGCYPHAHLLGRHSAHTQIGQALALRHGCQATRGISGRLQNTASVMSAARRPCSAPGLKCTGIAC